MRHALRHAAVIGASAIVGPAAWAQPCEPAVSREMAAILEEALVPDGDAGVDRQDGTAPGAGPREPARFDPETELARLRQRVASGEVKLDFEKPSVSRSGNAIRITMPVRRDSADRTRGRSKGSAKPAAKSKSKPASKPAFTTAASAAKKRSRR